MCVIGSRSARQARRLPPPLCFRAQNIELSPSSRYRIGSTQPAPRGSGPVGHPGRASDIASRNGVSMTPQDHGALGTCRPSSESRLHFHPNARKTHVASETQERRGRQRLGWSHAPAKGTPVQARQGAQHLGPPGARDQGGLCPLRRAHGRREGRRHPDRRRAACHGVCFAPIVMNFYRPERTWMVY